MKLYLFTLLLLVDAKYWQGLSMEIGTKKAAIGLGITGVIIFLSIYYLIGE